MMGGFVSAIFGGGKSKSSTAAVKKKPAESPVARQPSRTGSRAFGDTILSDLASQYGLKTKLGE